MVAVPVPVPVATPRTSEICYVERLLSEQYRGRRNGASGQWRALSAMTRAISFW